mmetsp:Transcript_1506/g.2661  ORF Transcript_1506/g.2661 Transcript_1506/m.2661 type:complete len:86 (-) Transcript_1506:107-364(-)
MLPTYLVVLLTYFYLRTKNFKMARALVKSRRFVIDQDHIVQQLKVNQLNQQSSGPIGQQISGQKYYSKKQQPLMNYKSVSGNFTC